MVVPGKNDSPISVGSHRLIKEGARLVDCVEDVMETLGYIGEDLKGHCQFNDVRQQLTNGINVSTRHYQVNDVEAVLR